MPKTRLRLISLFPCLLLAGISLSASAIERAPIDAAFDDTLSRYRLPGLALGIVQDGKVVYRRTAGELAAGTGDPVDADTLFKIA
ncbi:MAG TPA: serine hydrolase, partial [Pseudoxanthomonas sp.]|nr:serine hydrolase [Pseudoxanthomonas sp.]